VCDAKQISLASVLHSTHVFAPFHTRMLFVQVPYTVSVFVTKPDGDARAVTLDAIVSISAEASSAPRGLARLVCVFHV
jgi:hypothetical protein